MQLATTSVRVCTSTAKLLAVSGLVLSACLIPADCGAAAEGVSGDPLAAWREIPVLEDGRIMPLDTFARRRVETITNTRGLRLHLPRTTSRRGGTLITCCLSGSLELRPVRMCRC